MGSRSHSRHPRDPMRRTWPYRSAPLPLTAGGQGRTASDLTATARDLLRVLAAGLALAGLTCGLGELARACL